MKLFNFILILVLFVFVTQEVYGGYYGNGYYGNNRGNYRRRSYYKKNYRKYTTTTEFPPDDGTSTNRPFFNRFQNMF